jgi:phosphatidylcholine synthase
VLVFVPIKYLYPSRTEKLWYVNMTLATLWLALWAAITASLPDAPVALVALSLVYVVYYVAVSLWLTFSPSSAHPASRSAAESAARPSNS